MGLAVDLLVRGSVDHLYWYCAITVFFLIIQSVWCHDWLELFE
jgi:hypothetical protein